STPVQMKSVQIDASRDELADDGLLRLHLLVCVNDEEIELRAHGQVLFKDAALKNAKTFIRLGRDVQIHPSFEVLQFRPIVQNAVQRNIEVRFEKERQVRQRGEIVNAAHPFRPAAAH